jgi:hypothetical protein
MDEEELISWQDVLDEIGAGRPDGQRCPFCREGTLVVEGREEGVHTGRIHVSCPRCKKFIEGSLGG